MTLGREIKSQTETENPKEMSSHFQVKGTKTHARMSSCITYNTMLPSSLFSSRKKKGFDMYSFHYPRTGTRKHGPADVC